MVYALGRFLEMVGLCVVLLGLVVGLSYGAIRAELLYLAGGAGIFALGYLLERRHRPGR